MMKSTFVDSQISMNRRAFAASSTGVSRSSGQECTVAPCRSSNCASCSGYRFSVIATRTPSNGFVIEEKLVRAKIITRAADWEVIPGPVGGILPGTPNRTTNHKETPMERMKASDFPQEVLNIFDLYIHGHIDRR